MEIVLHLLEWSLMIEYVANQGQGIVKTSWDYERW